MKGLTYETSLLNVGTYRVPLEGAQIKALLVRITKHHD